MFSDSKYTRWYFSIIDRTRLESRDKSSAYYECHHIIPRSMGGTNSLKNRVLLTAREHFICHLLLTKMTTGLSKRKMVLAARMMSRDIRLRDGTVLYRYRPRISKLYEMARHAKCGSTPPEVAAKISASLTGWAERKKLIDPIGHDAMRAKQSATHSGKILPEITCKRMGDSRRGKKRTENVIEKMKASMKIIGATIKDPNDNLHIVDSIRHFCASRNIDHLALLRSYKLGKPLEAGPLKGWQVIGRTE